MLGTHRKSSGGDDSSFSTNPADRAKQIFEKMDTNADGILEEKEFIEGTLQQ